MEAPNPLPKYVYKIIPSAPPDPIPEVYPLSDLDKKDGFVHLSTSWQIPITADLFFTSSNSIWVLKLRRERFDPASIRWDEVEGTNGCPHLYGNFGATDVESGIEVKRQDGKTWKETLKVETWLE